MSLLWFNLVAAQHRKAIHSHLPVGWGQIGLKVEVSERVGWDKDSLIRKWIKLELKKKKKNQDMMHNAVCISATCNPPGKQCHLTTDLYNEA